MIKNGTNKLYISLAALTVFGSGAFSVGFSSENGVDFISSALSLIITAATLALAVKLGARIYDRIDLNENLKTAWSVVFLLSGVLCLFFALCSLVDLTQICSGTLADRLEIGVIILSLILILAAVVASKKKALLKFALILFPVVFGLVLLIFLLSTPYMSIKYLALKTLPQTNSILIKTAQKLIRGILPVCLPLVVVCFNKPSSAVLGGTIGMAFLLVTVANTILIFGSEFASELSYPYAQAVGAVSLGELFSRMDVALYPICFFPGIIRTSVQTLAAIKLFKKAKNIRKISINY